MKRMRLAALVLCGLILTVFFNYIYVSSVRSEMLDQVAHLSAQYSSLPSPNQLVQTWNNRKGTLSLFVPLAVIDQIDMQLSTMEACVITKDCNAYLCACYHLQELLDSLQK